MEKPNSATRRRNAAATREAILRSARAAFARSGYDGAGVREIAQGAGVTAMLVNRYFGSKEQLFAEVAAATQAETTLLTDAVLNGPEAGRDMARALVGITAKGGAVLEGFEITLRSAASERAAEIGREQIEKHKLAQLASVLRGEHSPQRAALILSLVAGLQAMRQMIGLSALNEVDPDVLVDLLAPILQQLLDGAIPTETP